MLGKWVLIFIALGYNNSGIATGNAPVFETEESCKTAASAMAREHHNNGPLGQMSKSGLKVYPDCYPTGQK